MNKEQYKRGWSLYRKLELLKELMAAGTHSQKYLDWMWDCVSSELNSIKGNWVVIQHYKDSQVYDKYEDLWWLYDRFPTYYAHTLETKFLKSRIDPDAPVTDDIPF